MKNRLFVLIDKSHNEAVFNKAFLMEGSDRSS